MNDKTRLMSPLAVISFPSRSWCWWTFETQQRRTTLINKMQECCNIGPTHLVLLDVKLRCKGDLLEAKVLSLLRDFKHKTVCLKTRWVGPLCARRSSTVLLLLLWLVNTCTILMISQLWKYQCLECYTNQFFLCTHFRKTQLQLNLIFHICIFFFTCFTHNNIPV